MYIAWRRIYINAEHRDVTTWILHYWIAVTPQRNIRKWFFIRHIFFCHISCNYLVNGKILKNKKKIYITWNVRFVLSASVNWSISHVMYRRYLLFYSLLYTLLLQYYRWYGLYIKQMVSYVLILRININNIKITY